MILNGRRAVSTFSWYRGKIGYPAYQEPAKKRYWEKLNGAKDDIIIYDRCGRLSAHIKMPKSDLGKFSYVQQELFKADQNGVCGKCSQPSNTTPPTRQVTATATGTSSKRGTATGTPTATGTGSTATATPSSTPARTKKSKKKNKSMLMNNKKRKQTRKSKKRKNKKTKKTKKSQG